MLVAQHKSINIHQIGVPYKRDTLLYNFLTNTQVHGSWQAYDVINRTHTMVSFISLKLPSHKMLNKGYGPLGHPRRPAGREQTGKFLNVGHLTRQKVSNSF